MDLDGYELEFEDDFEAPVLDRNRWYPYYLPQWSSRERSRARYLVCEGQLRLRIEAEQEPWCPPLDGGVRVSSLQTGVFAGAAGSPVGQHRFHPDAIVTEEVAEERLYTPRYGVIEARAQAVADPNVMTALWMIGFEDAPERSGEICLFEIFGSEIGSTKALVGMGIHPFGDPRLVDDFEKVEVEGDVCEFHSYAVEWTPETVTFFFDGKPVKTAAQSPGYPMQLMLGIYEFDRTPADRYPKEFVIDRVRGYRPRPGLRP
jgi:hypothetical protein